jgi:hypothetical protein
VACCRSITPSRPSTRPDHLDVGGVLRARPQPDADLGVLVRAQEQRLLQRHLGDGAPAVAVDGVAQREQRLQVAGRREDHLAHGDVVGEVGRRVGAEPGAELPLAPFALLGGGDLLAQQGVDHLAASGRGAEPMPALERQPVPLAVEGVGGQREPARECVRSGRWARTA